MPSIQECRVHTQCHLAAWCSDPLLPILQVQLKTTERRRLDADNLLRGTSVQECVFTKDGVKECTDGEMIWELVDPDMTGIPNNFLKGSKGLTGTLKLGAAVKKIGKNAFLKTKLIGGGSNPNPGCGANGGVEGGDGGDRGGDDG